MGWLAIAQNEKYQLLSREQPRPADPGAAAARLDHRPQRQADRDQPVELPRRPHPAADRQRAARSSPSCRKLLEPAARRGRPDQPRACAVARLPAGLGRRQRPLRAICGDHRPPARACRASRRRAASPASIPAGSAVGQLVGYVGAASAAEYEKENKNPLLLDPRREDRQGRSRKDAGADASRPARRAAGRSHRARQAGQGARPQARPQRRHRPADDRRRPPRICGAADRRPVRRRSSSST